VARGAGQRRVPEGAARLGRAPHVRRTARPIYALADRSPGFVSRLQSESGDATSIRVFDDDRIIVNLSVWETIEDLRAYVFASAHDDVLRRRREWFGRMVDAHLAVWWIARGEIPTVEDAAARLAALREAGPSAEAFTLRDPFPQPGRSHRSLVGDETA
jgi:hypothetical protein